MQLTTDTSIARTTQHPIRAAQYVRMSTEHQKYSTENQAEIISQVRDNVASHWFGRRTAARAAYGWTAAMPLKH